MTDWHLRKAIADDADGLADCLRAAYAPFAKTITDLPDVADDCAGQIAGSQVWVIEQDRAIIAGLALTPGDGHLYLSNVAVHPDHKGKGLGRYLISKAEAEAAMQGFAALYLTTHAMMPENVGLYSRLGYRVEGRAANKVFMRKEL